MLVHLLRVMTPGLASGIHSSMLEYARSLARAFQQPIRAELRRHLDEAWQRLPERLRAANQFLGRQYAGCGATIGAMPRCDFTCRGCYLGAGANRARPRGVDEIKDQLRTIRSWLGPGGNVQLTDGEITLRAEDELVEMVRFAREIDLVPMLMTHGESFRRKPDLLPRLMVEGGLSEISIHVDTTQQGRREDRDSSAASEAELFPLRAEFADMIRRVRSETGRTLDAATTFTVTGENLAEIPLVMRWMCANADAFKMISFQPIAQVGRTEPGLGGSASVEALWKRIADGLFGPDADPATIRAAEGWLGHPACSRFVQGVVVRERDREPVFHPLFRTHDAVEQSALSELVARFGGLTFRLDDRLQAVARLLGLVRQSPGFFVSTGPALLAHWLRRAAPHDPIGFLLRWLRGDAQVDYLNVVSHHFMSRAELETDTGRERLDTCVFQVPIGERLVSMCEVNALGLREQYYRETRAA